MLILSFSLQSVEALSGASYDSKSLSTLLQDANIYCLEFSPDGTKAYVCGNTNDKIFQYTLTTAWDVSTGSYASKSCTVSGQTADPHAMTFNADGTKMYVAGNTVHYQYSLSSAYDMSTCSYDSVSLTTSTEDTSARESFWKPGGLIFYFTGVQNDKIYQYTCSSAYSLSSCSYASKSLTVSGQDTLPAGIYFRNDGLKAYMIGGGRVFYRYVLTTAWDTSTGSYDSDSYNATAQGIESATGMSFSSDGTKMYYVDRLTAVIYQYSTAEVWPVAGNGLGFGGMF